MTHTDHLHGSLICQGVHAPVWLERSAWDFSHATRITLRHSVANHKGSQNLGSVLRVDQHDTLETVLSVVLVGDHTPVAVTLNLCTDHADGGTKVLASEHLRGSSLVNGVAIAQVSRDALGLRSLRAVVLAVEGVLEHEPSTESGEGVVVVANSDIGGTVIPIVRGAAGTVTGGGIAIAHLANLQNQTGSFERVGYAVCRSLP